MSSFRHKGVRRPFDPKAFAAVEDFVRSGKDLALAPARPGFDFAQARELRDNHVKKRSIDDYKAVLEHHGFSYLTDLDLVRKGLAPTGSGRWTNWETRDALATDDVLSMFDNPEHFDKWFKKMKLASDLAKKAPKLPQGERRIILSRS